MAITIQKRMLSGSTDGQSIGVSTTAGGTHNTLHTGPSGTSIIDEVYLFANNGYSGVVELVLEWGVSTTSSHRVFQVPPREGEIPISTGQLILGSGTAPTIKAFIGGLNGSASLAASSAFVTVYGWVNRITQS